MASTGREQSLTNRLGKRRGCAEQEHQFVAGHGHGVAAAEVPSHEQVQLAHQRIGTRLAKVAADGSDAIGAQ